MQIGVPIVNDLSEVFPDIEGELCSRHSILMGKLKNTFNKIYDRTPAPTQTSTRHTTQSSKAYSLSTSNTKSTSRWP